MSALMERPQAETGLNPEECFKKKEKNIRRRSLRDEDPSVQSDVQMALGAVTIDALSGGETLRLRCRELRDSRRCPFTVSVENIGVGGELTGIIDTTIEEEACFQEDEA